MSSLVQADVFFFITSIAVLVGTILLVVIGIYVVRILHRIHRAAAIVETEIQHIQQDINNLRAGVRDRIEIAERSPLTSIIGSVIAHFRGKPPKKRRRTATRKTQKSRTKKKSADK